MFVIPIKFKYDADSEAQSIKKTLDNWKWFEENKYNPILPNGIKNDSGNDIEKIKKAVEDEFNLEIYQTAEKAIVTAWEKSGIKIKNINEKLIGSNQLNELNIILTRYGTGGSYCLPNLIVINISNRPPEFLIKTVIHESIHLMIEPLIQKYSVEHWVKERIVNLIIDIEYKSRLKMNSSPDWATDTDPIFKEYYPDLIPLMEKAKDILPKSI